MKTLKTGLALLLAAGLLLGHSVGIAAAGTKTLQGLVQHVEAQVGMLYWYGTFGQAPTQDLLDRKRAQYPSQYAPQRYDYAKQYHVGKADKRVYDCAGLIKSYWMQQSPTAAPVYRVEYDKSAHQLYQLSSTRGSIGTMPKTAGTLVFQMNSSGVVHHVGVYVGSGAVVEARGFAYGVVRTALNSRGWTHWGQLPLAWLPSSAKDWRAGDKVRVIAGTTEYYPGQKMKPWVAGQVYTIAQTEYRGKQVTKGGKRCVLLKEVYTWCAVEHLVRL